jgi:hypothetical protein
VISSNESNFVILSSAAFDLAIQWPLNAVAKGEGRQRRRRWQSPAAAAVDLKLVCLGILADMALLVKSVFSLDPLYPECIRIFL